MHNPIIVALDVETVEAARKLVVELAPHVGAFKVGKELFVTAGPELVREIRNKGGKVFLDLKFHDIPNTVARAVAAATRLDVQMLTVHASGGPEMMEAARKAADETAAQLKKDPPLILAVTVLTSMDSRNMEQIGLPSNVGKQVERLAMLAASSGAGGLVCSAMEIGALRPILPPKMKLATPGIRPAGTEPGDQKRTMSPKEAIEAGADWLVIGRPIYQAEDPAQAAAQILESLK